MDNCIFRFLHLSGELEGVTEYMVLLQSGGQSQAVAFLRFQVGQQGCDLRAREKATACQGLHTASPGEGGSDQGVQPGYRVGGHFICVI